MSNSIPTFYQQMDKLNNTFEISFKADKNGFLNHQGYQIHLGDKARVFHERISKQIAEREKLVFSENHYVSLIFRDAS